MDGTSVVKKVWDGRANLAEYAADGPAGHVELLALRWFNPTTKEWNIDFATPGGGTLEPLLLPWGGVKSARYTWTGSAFVNR